MYDVVVVGGGPAGCRTASLLAKDHDVLVLEEHRESGLPVQCAGLITSKTISMSGVKPDILNKFYGANVIFPGGYTATVHSSEIKAYMVDRADLDRKIAESAIDAGAEIRYSTKYDYHIVKDGKVTVHAGGKEIETKMIIGADGHSSRVSDSIIGNSPPEYLRGLQYDIRKKGEDMDMITIRIGTDIAPGLFSWEAPFDDCTRAGLCVSWDAGLPSEFMKVLLKRSGLEGYQKVSSYSGKIPVGKKRRTYDNNLLLVGDAASQVKPVSAGGLYPAMKCIPHLCRTVGDAFANNDFSSDTLSKYEKSWHSDVGKELDYAYSLRKIYLKCTNDDMDRMYECVGNKRASRILDSVDIDEPSRCARTALKNPLTIMRLARIMMKAKGRK